MTNKPSWEELREKLADIEHQRWSDWQKYVHTKLGKDINEYNHFRLPSLWVERWERQINTPYEELSEKEKDSDREQVDRYWPLIQEYLTQREQEIVEMIQNAQGYVAKIPKIDPSIGDLEEDDIDFIKAEYGQILFKAELISFLKGSNNNTK